MGKRGDEGVSSSMNCSSIVRNIWINSSDFMWSLIWSLILRKLACSADPLNVTSEGARVEAEGGRRERRWGGSDSSPSYM